MRDNTDKLYIFSLEDIKIAIEAQEGLKAAGFNRDLEEILCKAFDLGASTFAKAKVQIELEPEDILELENSSKYVC